MFGFIEEWEIHFGEVHEFYVEGTIGDREVIEPSGDRWPHAPGTGTSDNDLQDGFRHKNPRFG
jgi:hypothetical protein